MLKISNLLDPSWVLKNQTTVKLFIDMFNSDDQEEISIAFKLINDGLSYVNESIIKLGIGKFLTVIFNNVTAETLEVYKLMYTTEELKTLKMLDVVELSKILCDNIPMDITAIFDVTQMRKMGKSFNSFGIGNIIRLIVNGSIDVDGTTIEDKDLENITNNDLIIIDELRQFIYDEVIIHKDTDKLIINEQQEQVIDKMIHLHEMEPLTFINPNNF